MRKKVLTCILILSLLMGCSSSNQTNLKGKWSGRNNNISYLVEIEGKDLEVSITADSGYQAKLSEFITDPDEILTYFNLDADTEIFLTYTRDYDEFLSALRNYYAIYELGGHPDTEADKELQSAQLDEMMSEVYTLEALQKQLLLAGYEVTNTKNFIYPILNVGVTCLGDDAIGLVLVDGGESMLGLNLHTSNNAVEAGLLMQKVKTD